MENKVIYERKTISEDIENQEDTEIIDFGDLGTTEVLTAINTSSNPIEVNAPSTNLTIFKGVVNGSQETYLYVGSGDVYGDTYATMQSNELELLEQEDFLITNINQIPERSYNDLQDLPTLVTSVNTQTGDVVLDADDIDDSTTTNKFTTQSERDKLSGIEAGAEVNVQSDWDATAGDAFILNKPTLGNLEAIDEGNGVGYRIKGRDPNKHGNIGLNAVDLSYQSGVFLTRGATGFSSYAEGAGTVASGDHSHAEGFFTVASGDHSHAEGNNTEASGARSHAEGSATVASGYASHAQGIFTTARSQSEFSAGEYGTNYTPANDDTDRLANFGNGTNFSNRSDAFTIFKNGAVKFFKDKLSNIANAMAGMFILNTNDNNRPTIHNGTEWKGLAYVDEIVVDDAFSDTSTNPLENRIVSTLRHFTTTLKENLSVSQVKTYNNQHIITSGNFAIDIDESLTDMFNLLLSVEPTKHITINPSGTATVNKTFLEEGVYLLTRKKGTDEYFVETLRQAFLNKNLTGTDLEITNKSGEHLFLNTEEGTTQVLGNTAYNITEATDGAFTKIRSNTSSEPTINNNISSDTRPVNLVGLTEFSADDLSGKDIDIIIEVKPYAFEVFYIFIAE